MLITSLICPFSSITAKSFSLMGLALRARLLTKGHSPLVSPLVVVAEIFSRLPLTRPPLEAIPTRPFVGTRSRVIAYSLRGYFLLMQ